MPKLNYQLKEYIKAVEVLASFKKFDRVEHFPTKGSIYRFELFITNETEPCEMWVIHHEHNNRKIVWSKEDYKKAARALNATLEEFISILESI